MHKDTKSAQLIAVCKRTLICETSSFNNQIIYFIPSIFSESYSQVTQATPPAQATQATPPAQAAQATPPAQATPAAQAAQVTQLTIHLTPSSTSRVKASTKRTLMGSTVKESKGTRWRITTIPTYDTSH